MLKDPAPAFLEKTKTNNTLRSHSRPSRILGNVKEDNPPMASFAVGNKRGKCHSKNKTMFFAVAERNPLISEQYKENPMNINICNHCQRCNCNNTNLQTSNSLAAHISELNGHLDVFPVNIDGLIQRSFQFNSSVAEQEGFFHRCVWSRYLRQESGKTGPFSAARRPLVVMQMLYKRKIHTMQAQRTSNFSKCDPFIDS